MQELIEKVMIAQNEKIKNLKYSLHYKEVMEVALISREACEYYDNGVVFLLAYFLESSKRL